MDLDDILPRKSGDPLSELSRQDLDPFSVDELHARIATLEAEIARTRSRIGAAVNHLANAEGLFKTMKAPAASNPPAERVLIGRRLIGGFSVPTLGSAQGVLPPGQE